MERTGEHLPDNYGSKTSDLHADLNAPPPSGPLLSGRLPSGPLRLLRVVDLPAPAAMLFDYITDHNRICDFVPGMLTVSVDNGSAVVSGGQGCVRYCDFGNDMVVAETIVLWNPPEAFGFRIASPNPFGLYDHLALITIEEVGGQSRLTWRQYYDHADLPTMNAFMAEMLDGVVGHLTGRFGGRVVRAEEGGRENVSLASRVGVKSEWLLTRRSLFSQLSNVYNFYDYLLADRGTNHERRYSSAFIRVHIQRSKSDEQLRKNSISDRRKFRYWL